MGFSIFSLSEALALFERNDYGDAYGPIGVIMRMGDKIKRLVSISKRELSMMNPSWTPTLSHGDYAIERINTHFSLSHSFLS